MVWVNYPRSLLKAFAAQEKIARTVTPRGHVLPTRKFYVSASVSPCRFAAIRSAILWESVSAVARMTLLLLFDGGILVQFSLALHPIFQFRAVSGDFDSTMDMHRRVISGGYASLDFVYHTEDTKACGPGKTTNTSRWSNAFQWDWLWPYDSRALPRCRDAHRVQTANESSGDRHPTRRTGYRNSASEETARISSKLVILTHTWH